MTVTWRKRVSAAVLLCLGSAVWADAANVEIRGGVLTPEGEPGIGYRVVFTSLESGEESISEPADFDGEYIVSVPPDDIYLAAYVLPAGNDTRHPIENSPRIVIRDRGVVINVQLVNGTANASLTGVGESGSTLASAKKPRRKRTGMIVGIVLGATAGTALLASGGGSDDASPFEP